MESGLSYSLPRVCSTAVRGDGFRPYGLTVHLGQILSHVGQYYKIHGRLSDALLSQAVLVRIDCTKRMEDPYPDRNLLFMGNIR